jgi:hypothetical protein
MRKSLFTLVLVFLSTVAFAEFKAGIAFRNVTPDPLLPLVGGFGVSSPATESKGELTVRALVVEQGNTRVALCSTDFIGFPSPLCKRVREKVSTIPPENILISATHNHSGPDTHGFPDGRGRTSTDMKYINMVCGMLADAINEAVDKLQPASIRIATGNVRGKVAYNYYAPMLYDPRCTVIQTLDANDKVFATLLNYAVHPDVVGDENGLLCPDLVGPLYDRIQESGGGTPIFINGAEGGMIVADNRIYERPKDPASHYWHLKRTWQECLRIGHLLADESLRIVNGAPIQTEPALKCVSKTIDFPIDNKGFRALVASSPIDYGLEDPAVAPIQVNLVNLGNAQMLTIPGEALPNISYYLKRKMTGKHNMILGLTNDHIGYILIPEDWNSFQRYRYITSTCMGEMTGEILINAGLDLANANPIK